MKLRFFGRLRDAVGAGDFDRALPPQVDDSDALRLWLGREYPALLDDRVRIALDDRLIHTAASLDGVAEAAFLPPVSGG